MSNMAREEESGTRKKASAGPSGPTASVAGTEQANKVIMTQAAAGSFSLASVKVFLPSATMDGLRAAFSSLPASAASKAELLLASAVVCAYFAVRLAGEKEIWQLVVQKAKRWLRKEQATVGIPDSFDWDTPAAAFVRANC